MPTLARPRDGGPYAPASDRPVGSARTALATKPLTPCRPETLSAVLPWRTAQPNCRQRQLLHFRHLCASSRPTIHYYTAVFNRRLLQRVLSGDRLFLPSLIGCVAQAEVAAVCNSVLLSPTLGQSRQTLDVEDGYTMLLQEGDP